MADSISSNFGHFDDVVFEKRNKEYGAYPIRQSYSFNIFMGLIVGLFIIGTTIIIPYINAYFKAKKEVIVQKNVEVTLKNPDSLDEEEDKPEFKPKEEPKMDLIKFTVPIVTTEEVEEITTQEDLEVSNPGNITQEGDIGFTGLPDGDGDAVIGETKTEEIFTVVEQMPQFPGGDAALNEFLDNNMQYPTMAKEQGVQGKVWIGFIVDKFGNVSNVELMRGIGGGCDEEAMRVVKLMPRWNPGKQSGRPVVVKFRFPIKFTLR